MLHTRLKPLNNPYVNTNQAHLFLQEGRKVCKIFNLRISDPKNWKNRALILMLEAKIRHQIRKKEQKLSLKSKQPQHHQC
jgi:hypothetical protein